MPISCAGASAGTSSLGRTTRGVADSSALSTAPRSEHPATRSSATLGRTSELTVSPLCTRSVTTVSAARKSSTAVAAAPAWSPTMSNCQPHEYNRRLQRRAAAVGQHHGRHLHAHRQRLAERRRVAAVAGRCRSLLSLPPTGRVRAASADDHRSPTRRHGIRHRVGDKRQLDELAVRLVPGGQGQAEAQLHARREALAVGHGQACLAHGALGHPSHVAVADEPDLSGLGKADAQPQRRLPPTRVGAARRLGIGRPGLRRLMRHPLR